MTDTGEMVCNVNKCRRPLSTRAWVTSCLHAFCDEDGTKYVHQTPVKCPTCDTTLSDRLDIIQIEVNPGERFKSMVLAGLKPDIICDVAGRALAFWMYQMSEDRAYLSGVVTRDKRRFNDLERYYEKHIRQLQGQMDNMRLQLDKEATTSARQLAEAQQELEAARRQTDELSGRLAQRNKHYQQLQREFDALRVRGAGAAHAAAAAAAAARSPARSPARSGAASWHPLAQSHVSPLPRRVSHVSQFVFKPVTPQRMGESP